MATSEETARKTRAEASQRSVRRISPGPMGALSRHRNRSRRARNGNGIRPRLGNDVTDIIGNMTGEQEKLRAIEANTFSVNKLGFQGGGREYRSVYPRLL